MSTTYNKMPLSYNSGQNVREKLEKDCQELLTILTGDIFTQCLNNEIDNSCKLRLASGVKAIK